MQPAPSQDHGLTHRRDIEGLRAVAILLVVAAHAKLPWLSGGFVGVDIFFVLSGYLITGVLMREIDSNGHLGFAGFYARRFGRLLPALIVMLVGVCIFCAITLSPADQISQAITAATAAVWLSNFHFAFANLDYFGPSAESNLFLHTWSLGVEEQFYLVWPVLLVWASRRRWTLDRQKKLMLLVVILSLSACVLLTQVSPQIAFYLMPMRAWQFAIGALVWLHFGTSGKGTENPAVDRRLVGWIGTLLIASAAIWFDSNDSYPGLRALLPTLGAAAVIAAGTSGTTSGIPRLLASRPLQSIGRISYSWYLWHWPVLLLGAVFIDTGSPTHRLALVALSYLLAMLSSEWIESPLRNLTRRAKRPGVVILGALGVMVAVNVLSIRWHNDALEWMNSPQQRAYASAHADMPAIYPMGCDEWFRGDTVNICGFGRQDARHTAVLMGDSIGAQWFPAAAKAFDSPNWRLLVLTKSSCPMADVTLFDPTIGRDFVECSRWRSNALKQMADLKPDIVILGSASTYDIGREGWVEGTRRVLSTISASAGHIYILRSTPQMPFNGPSCLSSGRWLSGFDSKPDRCQSIAYSKQGNDAFDWIKEAGSHFANVTALDLNDAVCPDGLCKAERQGYVVFRDNQHLTASFSTSLSALLASKLDLQPRSVPTPPLPTASP